MRWFLPVLTAVYLLQSASCRDDSKSSIDDDALDVRCCGVHAGRPHFEELFQVASQAVVNVSASFRLPIPERLLRSRKRKTVAAVIRSLGSGFIVDTKGYVITCYSVVRDAISIEIVLSDSRRLAANLVGFDEIWDLAVLKIPAEHSLRRLVFGDSERTLLGTWVAAIGYPFGLEHTMTVGVLSGYYHDSARNAFDGWLVTDAAVNPGSNGGPLLNLSGEVIGVNYVASGSNEDIGIAVDSKHAVRLIKSVDQGLGMKRIWWLGCWVQIMDAKLAESFGLERVMGVLVNQVRADSPAERAGIRVADVILSVDKKPVHTPQEFIISMGTQAPEDSVGVQVYRSGKIYTLEIKPADFLKSDDVESK